MSSDVMAFRVVTAAIGLVLIGKLVYDYFSRSPKLVQHPDLRVRQLNRWRVYSVIIAFGGVALAPLAFKVGVPVLGVFIMFGIAIIAMIICLVCTVRVILITGHL